MSTHCLHTEARQVFFCTVTCYRWLNLISETNTYSSVYRWFKHLKNDGCLVTGYVIMPNHFHVMLYLTHSGTALNLMIGECKRFMAYEIVSRLRSQRKTDILNLLESIHPSTYVSVIGFAEVADHRSR